jgi:hypothetical protein
MNNDKILVYIMSAILLIIIYYVFFKKDSFYNLQAQALAENASNDRTAGIFTNQVAPAVINNDILTQTQFNNMFSNLIDAVYANGPSGGANISVDQNKYDLLFKDILVNSEKRNIIAYPNPNKYSLILQLNINNIYKAELIEVYIPAATDDSVNIPKNGNRLYFTYTAGTKTTSGYIVILAGTYLSPDAIAAELSNQFKLILQGSCVVTKTNKGGIAVTYNRNLNRYFFSDYNYSISNTIVIYPTNGYVINMDLTVENSICSYIMLNYEGPTIFSPYVSGPTTISENEFGLYVDIATNYGEFTDSCGNIQIVPPNVEANTSNSIVSGQVLTNDRIYLSLGILNGQTYNIVADQNPNNQFGNVSNIFCQVPNNTCISSASVKTMINQPHMYSAIQFYNPPLNKLNTLDIVWYTEESTLLRILDHSFTIRVYYYQKRLVGTDFSIPIP